MADAYDAMLSERSYRRAMSVASGARRAPPTCPASSSTRPVVAALEAHLRVERLGLPAPARSDGPSWSPSMVLALPVALARSSSACCAAEIRGGSPRLTRAPCRAFLRRDRGATGRLPAHLHAVARGRRRRAGLWLVSYAVLCAAACLNRRITGVPVIALGMVSNIVAVVANGGHMPALPQALRAAGQELHRPGQQHRAGDASPAVARRPVGRTRLAAGWQRLLGRRRRDRARGAPGRRRRDAAEARVCTAATPGADRRLAYRACVATFALSTTSSHRPRTRRSTRRRSSTCARSAATRSRRRRTRLCSRGLSTRSTGVSHSLLRELVTTAAPRDRDREAERRRALAAKRFSVASWRTRQRGRDAGAVLRAQVAEVGAGVDRAPRHPLEGLLRCELAAERVQVLPQPRCRAGRARRPRAARRGRAAPRRPCPRSGPRSRSRAGRSGSSRSR